MNTIASRDNSLNKNTKVWKITFVNYSKRVPYTHSFKKLGAEIVCRKHHITFSFIFLELLSFFRTNFIKESNTVSKIIIIRNFTHKPNETLITCFLLFCLHKTHASIQVLKVFPHSLSHRTQLKSVSEAENCYNKTSSICTLLKSRVAL